ncbi:hypothetical protein LY78DRAFT_586258, partial [Colletotrichum sublineola]
TSIPKDASEPSRQRRTYASFGDEGVTATANAYGNLMQITRYFGESEGNPSGFISAQLAEGAHSTSAYYELERLQRLTSASVNPNDGSRMRFEGAEIHGDKTPELSFVRNRWPRFQSVTLDHNVSIQCLVSKTAVYQIYTFKLDKPGKDSHLRRFRFRADMYLLDLNFTEVGNGFERQPANQARDKTESDDDSEYEDSVRNTPSQESNCTASWWPNSKLVGDPRNPRNVGLFVSPFVGGFAQPPSRLDVNIWEVTVDAASWQKALKDGALEISFAYRLEMFDVCEDPASLPNHVLEEDLSEAKTMLSRPFEVLQLHKNPHLNFILWRNLEHILSVCSIPVISCNNSSTDQDVPIALTCGDLAGHRVVTKASFHAFRFLLFALKQIEEIRVKSPGCNCNFEQKSPDTSCDNSGCESYWRIWRVCLGHRKWLYDNWAASYQKKSEGHSRDQEEAQRDASQRWVSGAVIKTSTTNAQHSHDRRTDTALQIVKVGELFHSAEADHMPSVSNGFGEVVKSWLKDLNKTKMNGLHIFPRSRIDMLNRFYLVDHVLIWWAVRSAERLKLEPKLTFEPRGESNNPSNEFQRTIMKGFTTRNTTSRARTLATYRSISETGFFLEVENTIIFYAEEYGLFRKSTAQNGRAVWEETKNCQRHHSDRDDSEWEDPLQFALAVIFASQETRINAREPGQMHARVKDVLLNASSPNGLLAGQLDSEQEPVIYDKESMHNSYWSTTFEVPYILWKYQIPQPEAAELSTSSVNSAEHFHATLDRSDRPLAAKETWAKNEGLIIHQRLPFENLINQETITEISDRWFYDEPELFSFSPPDINNAQESENCKADDKSCHYGKGAIDYAIKRTPFPVLENGKAIMGMIVDVPETKTIGSKPTCNVVCENSANSSVLNAARILQFFQTNPTTALICYRTSSEAEEIGAFFDRHARYQRYFIDEAVAASNKWVTELHLSFWELDSAGVDSSFRSFPPAYEVPFPTSGYGYAQRYWIRRAVTSFGVDGDFLDQYWMCHFVEHRAKAPKVDAPANEHPADEAEIHKLDVRMLENGGEQPSWQQRKVLELVLFDRTLKPMAAAAELILKEVRALVLESLIVPESTMTTDPNAPMITDPAILLAEIDSDSYLSFSKVVHKVQYVLESLHDNLNKNLDKIQDWSDRERKRQHSTRWTQRDGEKYRSAIHKLQVSNDLTIQELKRARDTVASYKSSLAKRLERTQSELEFRGADDIRLFTYVTAVFLPIGFATSLFSMSEAPSEETLSYMIKTALIAVFITVFMLANAKPLRFFVEPTISLCKVAGRLLLLPIVLPLAMLFLSGITVWTLLKCLLRIIHCLKWIRQDLRRPASKRTPLPR